MESMIRIAVIGAGRWGPNLIRNFHNNIQSRVVGIADSDSARCQALKKHFHDVQVTTNVQEMLTHSEVDAVVICTPTVSHFELASLALKAGKHVFVEKPLTTSASQSEELIHMAEKAGKTLFVGHVFVYNPGIQVVRDLIQRGELGRLYYVQAIRTNLGPIRSDVSVLWDLAPHDLSILNFWTGKTPISVSAVGGCFLSEKREDVVFATYQYPDGLIANIQASWISPKKVREIVVVGEKKMVVWDDMNLTSPVAICNKSVSVDSDPQSIIDGFLQFRASIHEGDTLVPKIALSEPLKNECMAFLDAILHPEKSLSPGIAGRHVVSALEAAQQSLRSNGAKVQIS